MSDNHWRCQKQIKIPQSNKKIKKDFIRHNSVIAEVTRSNCRNDFYLIMLLIKNGLSPSWPHCFLRGIKWKENCTAILLETICTFISLYLNNFIMDTLWQLQQFHYGYFVVLSVISLSSHHKLRIVNKLGSLGSLMFGLQNLELSFLAS